jgi:ABC-type dipeptide/oligopeptide/nickel transport system permease subunit
MNNSTSLSESPSNLKVTPLKNNSNNASSRSPWMKALREIQTNKVALACVIILGLVAFVSIFASLIAPYDPDAVNVLDKKLLPPFFWEGGSFEHPLGTDSLGRDVLSRVLHGGRISLFIGVVPVFIGFALGVPIGLSAGYFGGKTDEILMRVNDCLLAFPSLLLALIIVAYLGQGLTNLMIAVGISYAPTFARVIRGAVMSERNKEYVASAVSLGASHRRIVWKHVFPNITASLIVIFTLNFASALLEAAGLSFLGLGVRAPTAEWGAMLADGKTYFYDGWWMIIFPGVMIFVVVMALNLLGDSLRDALDPRTNKR